MVDGDAAVGVGEFDGEVLEGSLDAWGGADVFDEGCGCRLDVGECGLGAGVSERRFAAEGAEAELLRLVVEDDDGVDDVDGAGRVLADLDGNDCVHGFGSGRKRRMARTTASAAGWTQAPSSSLIGNATLTFASAWMAGETCIST